jgi:hypothetical protein
MMALFSSSVPVCDFSRGMPWFHPAGSPKDANTILVVIATCRRRRRRRRVDSLMLLHDLHRFGHNGPDRFMFRQATIVGPNVVPKCPMQ